MNKGIIIHLDNDQSILDTGRNLFEQMGIALELITCKSKEEFNDKATKSNENLKCLIFDLVGKTAPGQKFTKEDAEFLSEVEKKYAEINIPIFIYSGYLEILADKFSNYGTVFKVDKSKSIGEIFEKIRIFLDSGFLDVFCPGGLLQTEIHKDIHKAFCKQFKSGEIENIIESVRTSSGENFQKRSIEIFKRIAIKALMSKLLVPVDRGMSTVNPIEHYYRRITEIDCWTGDIFSKKDATETIVILTPRCDISNGHTKELIVAEIEISRPELGNSAKKKRIEIIKGILTDNKQGKKYRWLPISPVFKGGKVMFSKYKIISIDKIKLEYDYTVTLSDDLTNELLGKLCAYFLRSGINTISSDEYDAYLEILNEVPDVQE